jgi:hypothetical protein
MEKEDDRRKRRTFPAQLLKSPKSADHLPAGGSSRSKVGSRLARFWLFPGEFFFENVTPVVRNFVL